MDDTPTHAGGIVYQHSNNRVEYLLVSAKDKPEQWVLPKGHIEPGENSKAAALREVLEETGIVAKIEAEIPKTIQFEFKGERVQVVFYLMKCVAEKSSIENRQLAWVPLAEAVQRISFEDTRMALKEADQIRSG